MAKFNIRRFGRAGGTGPIVATRTPATLTAEGGAGYLRDTKGELFMLGVVNLVGQDTFYETAAERDARFARLVRAVAVTDVDWLTRFVRWLRTDANLRSAPIVAACEGVKARLEAGLHGGNRALIAASMDRADEPGELLAYWLGHIGRALPMPVKRGLADAVKRLYTEFGLLRYDTDAHDARFADVLELAHPTAVHPSIKGTWQGDLFGYAVDRRHGNANLVPASLPMVAAQAALRARAESDPSALLDSDGLRSAGMTWEDVLPRVQGRLPVARVWEALIPSMGILALARNLRNFDAAGVSDAAAAQVVARFTDPNQVARSRMLPLRWLAAYEQAPSPRWADALDRALQASLGSVPTLGGRTLVLVDTSGSMVMRGTRSKSTVTRLKAAAVFGVSLAAKGETVDLVGFADGSHPFRHKVAKGASVIREADRFVARSGEDGHGTGIATSLRKSYRRHDRVVIISDMQTMDNGVSTAVPARVPIYGFNLGGYRATVIPAGAPNRIELGGLTDATFRMIPLIEAGRNATWPF